MDQAAAAAAAHQALHLSITTWQGSVQLGMVKATRPPSKILRGTICYEHGCLMLGSRRRIGRHGRSVWWRAGETLRGSVLLSFYNRTSQVLRCLAQSQQLEVNWCLERESVASIILAALICRRQVRVDSAYCWSFWPYVRQLTPPLSISALLYSHYSRRVKNGKTWHLLPRHHRRRRRGLSIRTVWPSYLQTGNEQAQGYAVSRETVAAPGRPVWPRPGEWGCGGTSGLWTPVLL